MYPGSFLTSLEKPLSYVRWCFSGLISQQVCQVKHNSPKKKKQKKKTDFRGEGKLGKLNFALWRVKDKGEHLQIHTLYPHLSFCYIINTVVGTAQKMLNKRAMVFSPHPTHSL